MPQVIIIASTQDALPSTQQFQTWIQAWSQATPNAEWGQPVNNGNVATINVKNLSVEQVFGAIRSDINTYNQTHPGDNTITVVVEEDDSTKGA